MLNLFYLLFWKPPCTTATTAKKTLCRLNISQLCFNPITDSISNSISFGYCIEYFRDIHHWEPTRHNKIYKILQRILIKTCSVSLNWTFAQSFAFSYHVVPPRDTHGISVETWPTNATARHKIPLEQLGQGDSRSTLALVCLHHSGNSTWE